MSNIQTDGGENIFDLKLSDFVTESLAMGVVPILRFLNKDEVETHQADKRDLVPPFEQTPVGLLEKQVRMYQRWITDINTKKGIDQNADPEKLKLIVRKLRNKIRLFNRAVLRLKRKP